MKKAVASEGKIMRNVEDGIFEFDAVAWFGFKILERYQRHFRRTEKHEAKRQR